VPPALLLSSRQLVELLGQRLEDCLLPLLLLGRAFAPLAVKVGRPVEPGGFGYVTRFHVVLFGRLALEAMSSIVNA
jgi:3'-phosphoadenosine 5'-phosphosulfate sulfotransferase